jgi:hypothetical protein
VAGIAPAIGLPGVAQSPSEERHGGRTMNDAVAMILLVEDDASTCGSWISWAPT